MVSRTEVLFRKEAVTGVEGTEIDGDERSLPVVTMNDVGSTRLPLHRLNRGEAEGCEALRVDRKRTNGTAALQYGNNRSFVVNRAGKISWPLTWSYGL